ncbi:MAG: acetyl-CoA C-acetyltransferase [Thermoleophilia bacterium]|nr:acetyl-CoA C-acetyltransferase [Thermoleophilia bacterium]
MAEAVIAGAVRTPIGSFLGTLSSVPATELGAIAVREALVRAGVAPADVGDVILGNCLSGGLGQGVARQVAIRAGVPDAVPATAVNQLCGSGLRAVAVAAQQVQLGDAEIVVAGGTESMSGAPYLLPKARTGYRMGNGEILDSMISDGLQCAIENVHMGVTAENVAAELEITRHDQDAFALESQRRTAEAVRAGRFDAEIVSVPVAQRRGDPVQVTADEHPRPATTTGDLAKLRPAFQADGTVTAGNASGINDGASAMLVMSRAAAERRGVAPQAVIRGWATAGVPARVMGLGPVRAVPLALAKAGVELADIDLIELNEAFAAQSLGVIRQLGLDPERTNVNGGAIALGHPVGASGARVLTTLLHEMERRDVRLGLATLCIGGGQGIAMVVERAG